MSTRDHALLNAAGITVADAAKLFAKSKQAIYSGMSSATEDEPYFSVYDAIVLFQDAKRRDASSIDELVKFIRLNYPQSTNMLALAENIGYEQVSRAIRESSSVVLAFNGNLDQVTNPDSTFARILSDLADWDGEKRFVVPGAWAVDCVKQYLNIQLPNADPRDDMTYLPSFVLVEKNSTSRAFFFLRLSVEEMHPSEATRLAKHFAPMSPESAQHKFA